MERVLVERLEGSAHDGPAIERSVWEPIASADLAEQAGDQATAEDHEDGDPVRGRREEDRAEQRERDDEHDRGGELGAGATTGRATSRRSARDHGRDAVEAAT